MEDSTSTQNPVTIAVIGGGLIGPRHAQSVNKTPNATLTALVDPAPHGPDIARSLSTAHFTSIAELLATPQKPQAAIICTPNHTHVALAQELSSAGVHVLVEKPISTTIESGRGLISHTQATGVHLLAGHHRRFNPYIAATRSQLDSGVLGRIIAVSGVWASFKPDAYFAPPLEWHQGPTGGSILINLVHDIDLLQYLLGPIVRVQAERTIKTRGYEADEGAAVLFRFRSGAVGTFLVTDASPSPFNLEAGTGENPMIPKVDTDRGAGGFYRIFGTEGSLSVPDMTRWSYDDGAVGGKSWGSELSADRIAVDEGVVPFDMQVEHFVRVVRGLEEPVCSGEEGLSALVVCDAVRRAMDSGEAVTIE